MRAPARCHRVGSGGVWGEPENQEAWLWTQFLRPQWTGQVPCSWVGAVRKGRPLAPWPVRYVLGEVPGGEETASRLAAGTCTHPWSVGCAST